MSVSAHFLLLEYVQEMMRFTTNVPSGRTLILFEPQPICLKISTMRYLTHARMVVRPDFPFSPPFIGKRDMPATANEEEKMYLECE